VFWGFQSDACGGGEWWFTTGASSIIKVTAFPRLPALFMYSSDYFLRTGLEVVVGVVNKHGLGSRSSCIGLGRRDGGMRGRRFSGRMGGGGGGRVGGVGVMGGGRGGTRNLGLRLANSVSLGDTRELKVGGGEAVLECRFLKDCGLTERCPLHVSLGSRQDRVSG